MSDDNTSESDAPSIQGLFFNEDEQQAFKVGEGDSFYFKSTERSL